MNKKHPTPQVHPAYQALYGKQTEPEQTPEQEALSNAHSKYGRTPEQQRAYIAENVHLLKADDLKELVDAMQASKAGDKGALKRLVKAKQDELSELKTRLQATVAGGEV